MPPGYGNLGKKSFFVYAEATNKVSTEVDLNTQQLEFVPMNADCSRKRVKTCKLSTYASFRHFWAFAGTRECFKTTDQKCLSRKKTLEVGAADFDLLRNVYIFKQCDGFQQKNGKSFLHLS